MEELRDLLGERVCMRFGGEKGSCKERERVARMVAGEEWNAGRKKEAG